MRIRINHHVRPGGGCCRLSSGRFKDAPRDKIAAGTCTPHQWSLGHLGHLEHSKRIPHPNCSLRPKNCCQAHSCAQTENNRPEIGSLNWGNYRWKYRCRLDCKFEARGRRGTRVPDTAQWAMGGWRRLALEC